MQLIQLFLITGNEGLLFFIGEINFTTMKYKEDSGRESGATQCSGTECTAAAFKYKNNRLDTHVGLFRTPPALQPFNDLIPLPFPMIQ